jgi:hypothetical protein
MSVSYHPTVGFISRIKKIEDRRRCPGGGESGFDRCQMLHVIGLSGFPVRAAVN